MAAVMIGIDPHKSSHTAVAIGWSRRRWAGCGCTPARTRPGSCWRGRRRGRSGPGRWRAPPGWGPAGPAAGRRRRAGAGRAAQAGRPGPAAASREHQQERPERRPSVAVAALDPRPPPGSRRRPHRHHEGWAKRHRELSACPYPGRLPAARSAVRPHPGGVRKAITPGWRRASWSSSARRSHRPARYELAGEFLDDIRRLNAKLRRHRRPTNSPPRSKASGTTLTGLSGVGPDVAATVIGDVARHVPVPEPGPLRRLQRHRPSRSVPRRPTRSTDCPARQPRLNHAIHMAASPRSAIPTARPGLLRRKAGRGQDAQGGAPLPQAPDQRRDLRGAGGRCPARCGCLRGGPGRATGEPLYVRGGRLTPRGAGSSDKPLPGLPPPYGPAPRNLSPQVSPTERFGIGPRTPSPI